MTMELFLPLGTPIGNCRTIALLGRGAHSEVYLTADEHGCFGAVKAYRPEFYSKDSLQGFCAVASSASRLTGSPATELVGGLDYPCVKMPLLPGHSLESLLGNRREVYWWLAEQIFYAVAAQLALAHEKGIVHGSLRPSNIFVVFGRRGLDSVRISDFGSYHLCRDSEVTAADSTLQYMSPEGEPSSAGDMYALGAIVFRLLIGRPPPLASRGVKEARVALGQVAIGAPSLRDSILGLLSPEISQRPRAADIAALTLEEGEKTTVVQTSSRRKVPASELAPPAFESRTQLLPVSPVAPVEVGEATQMVPVPTGEEGGFTVVTSVQRAPKQGVEARLLLLNVSLVAIVVVALIVLAVVS